MKRYRDRRAWLGLVLVLSLVIAAGFAIITRDGQRLDGMRGWDEDALLDRLGPPDRDVEVSESDGGPEFRSMALRRVTAEPPVRVRELVWTGPFRITHVWLEQQNGDWVVFDAYEYARWFRPKF